VKLIKKSEVIQSIKCFVWVSKPICVNPWRSPFENQE